jgi:hypothetical protein
MVAGLGVWFGARNFGEHLDLPIFARGCTVEADGQVKLSADQMASAATIAAVGVRQGMPERAVVVALATAYQESRLENIGHGDRDSIGLFQQRPSKGWGTPEQIQDPRYSATKFYAALKKVKGWEEMRITDAAQRVQRSAFPEAYEKWAGNATVLTNALLGNVTGAVSCTVGKEPTVLGDQAATALTDGLLGDWGKLDTSAPDDLTGLAVAVRSPQNGWRYAHWLVSHADDLGVKLVRFEDLEWTASKGSWNRTSAKNSQDKQVIAEVFTEAS